LPGRGAKREKKNHAKRRDHFGGSDMTALSAGGAKADEWCGYADHDNAVIECGYTKAADCEDSVGKRGVCFIDPDVALETRRAAPPPRHPDVTPIPRQNG
jgi:hypothetical protein